MGVWGRGASRQAARDAGCISVVTCRVYTGVQLYSTGEWCTANPGLLFCINLFVCARGAAAG